MHLSRHIQHNNVKLSFLQAANNDDFFLKLTNIWNIDKYN